MDPDLGNLLRAGYSDFVRPRLATSQKRLEIMSGSLEKEFTDGVMSREEYDLCSTRLKGLADIQKKLQALMPLADKVF